MLYANFPITAPVSGKCVPLDTVASRLFTASEADGGFAIIPTENTVSAPFDAIVTRVSADNCFVALSSLESDYEIIVAADFTAVGNNEFSLRVQAGQKVSKGDTLFELALGDNTMENGIVSVPCIVFNLQRMDQVVLNYGDAVRGETNVLTSAC